MELPMKTIFVSFAVGMLVGMAYALLRVKSPAPPLVALFGLLGMVWGEQLLGWFLAHKAPGTLGAQKEVSSVIRKLRR